MNDKVKLGALWGHTYPKIAQNACNEWPLHIFPLFKGVIYFFSLE